MTGIAYVVVVSLRYLAIVFGVIAVVGALRINVRYVKIALTHGARQAWRDLRSLNLESLLPIHVATVSFAMAGLVGGDIAELLSHFEDHPTWRMIYLPLNFLTMSAVMLISLFIRNKGERVVPIPPDHFADRVTVAGFHEAKLHEQEVLRNMQDRKAAQDERSHKQDQRDIHQDERNVAQNERGTAQNVRSTAQNERDLEAVPRADRQDARDNQQNERAIAQNDRGSAQNMRDSEPGEETATADDSSATADDSNA